MKIALLAPQAAGKTCYLSALYGEFAELNCLSSITNPFQFILNDSKQERKLNSMYEGLIDGIMPSGTSETTKYLINIFHKINDSSSTIIKLIDFPGGRLRNQGDSDKNIKEVKSMLASCDAFIILIDGGYSSKSKHQFNLKIGASKINEILYEVVKKKEGTKFALNGIPFIFVISKTDKIASNKDSLLKSYSNIQDYFPDFFSKNSNCVSVITQVSIGNNIDGEDKSKSKGEYNPRNILLPFYLSLGIGILSGARYSYDEKITVKDLRRKAEEVLKLKKSKQSSAYFNLSSRESAHIVERVKQFLVNFDYQSDLKWRHERSTSEAQQAQKELDFEITKLKNIELEIKTMREIGLSVINSIDRNVFSSKACEAMIYKKNERYCIKDKVKDEVATLFEKL